MKEIRRKVLKTIKAETPEEFDRQVNEILSVEDDADLQIHQNIPLLAYCTYTHYELIPETLSDKYELRGEAHNCKECPFCNTEGALWNQKKAYCETHERTTYITSRCCEWFYEQLGKGALQLENDTEG